MGGAALASVGGGGVPGEFDRWFATAFAVGDGLPAVGGGVVVAAVCAGLSAVLVVWEGLEEVVSFVPSSL